MKRLNITQSKNLFFLKLFLLGFGMVVIAKFTNNLVNQSDLLSKYPAEIIKKQAKG